MNHKVGQTRSYIKGLNRVVDPKQALNSIYHKMGKGLQADLNKTDMYSIIEHLGELQAYFAPKYIEDTTLSNLWLASACKHNCIEGNEHYSFIQTRDIKKTVLNPLTAETFKPQTVSVATDGIRMHIEWDTDGKEGYTHYTGKEYTVADFSDAYQLPPDFILALPGSEDCIGNRIELNDILEEDNFIYYLDNTYYRIFSIVIKGIDHIIIVNDRYLRDGLSGIDNTEHTSCYINITEKEMCDNIAVVEGSIRVDGIQTYRGTTSQRTVVIPTALLNIKDVKNLLGIKESI